MITEDYVSFEVAKLLKEKGFDEKCTHFYKNENYLVDLGYTNIHHYTNSDLVEEFVAPTLQMAMKWLRDIHNINIGILFNHLRDFKTNWNFYIEGIKLGRESMFFHTYEEACEEAIKYCLENLI